MTEQDIKIERLEKEIEILKKRVDYFYEEIRPYITECEREKQAAFQRRVNK